MKSFLITFFIMFSIGASAQLKLDIEGNPTGSDRQMVQIKNLTNDGTSFSGLGLYAAHGSNKVTNLDLSAFARSYRDTPLYSGYGMISNNYAGLLIRTTNAGGRIRLMTGGSNILNNSRVTIAPNGKVGINTGGTDAHTMLHIGAGNFYLEGGGNGIIMTSPDGSCYELTVSNAGALNVSSVTCP